jgi:hypothetical protein
MGILDTPEKIAKFAGNMGLDFGEPGEEAAAVAGSSGRVVDGASGVGKMRIR